MRELLIATVGAFAAGAVFGVAFSGHDPFPEFVPKFGDGEAESHLCYLIGERRGDDVAYAGCYSASILEKQREQWSKLGGVWPYRVIAVFDRELDAGDLDPRY